MPRPHRWEEAVTKTAEQLFTRPPQIAQEVAGGRAPFGVSPTQEQGLRYYRSVINGQGPETMPELEQRIGRAGVAQVIDAINHAARQGAQ